MSIRNLCSGRAALALLVLTNAATAAAQSPCPAADDLPFLTIAEIDNSVVPVVDKWQVLWSGVPLSDAQVARLAGDEPLISKTREEMESRGAWVFVGMGTAAAGAAVSSAGWVLYGQNELSQGITVPLAIGGLIAGIVGFLIVTQNIKSPLEPHIAPTPRHRITRDEMTRLVATINRTIFAGVCRDNTAERARVHGPANGDARVPERSANETDNGGAAADNMVEPSP